MFPNRTRLRDFFIIKFFLIIYILRYVYTTHRLYVRYTIICTLGVNSVLLFWGHSIRYMHHFILEMNPVFNYKSAVARSVSKTIWLILAFFECIHILSIAITLRPISPDLVHSFKIFTSPTLGKLPYKRVNV